MKRIATLAAIAALAFAGLTANTQQAEARRGGAVFAGIIAGAVIGGIIASSYNRRYYRSYSYYPSRSYAYSSVYYAPRSCYWRHGHRHCY